MAMVAPPAHISLPTLPTQQLDIAYASASDPSTPRAVLAHAAIDIVAAAVTLAPALSPALPAANPEYCLSSNKRKAIDDDDVLDVPRISKRTRSDDDVLFGSLTDTSLAEVASTDVDPMQASIEQALAVFLSYSPAPEVVDPSPLPPTPSSQPEPSHAASCRTPHSPLATSTTALTVDSIEESTAVDCPGARMPSPPRNRMVEPPLWKMACRTRVDQVITTYGGHAIRATVTQEHRSRSPIIRQANTAGVTHRASPAIADGSSDSGLELEIYTPVTYPQAPELSDKEEASVSDAESDIDMSFDLDDDDSDTDSDTTEEEEDSDLSVLSAHESLLDVPISEIGTDDRSQNDATSEGNSMQLDTTSLLPPPIAIPSSILMPSMTQSWPPRLPRLSSIPAYCLREYPQMELLGTPAQNHPFARGSLLRRCCHFAAAARSAHTSLVL